MPITRSREQCDETLDEFYRRKNWKGAFQIIANNMLGFIDLVDQLFPQTMLIAYTSHERLCIQHKDEIGLNCVVIVHYTLMNECYFEYKMPNDKSPWNDAWVRGAAKNLNDAGRYLIIAMLETQVWKDNKELMDLVDKYQISP